MVEIKKVSQGEGDEYESRTSVKSKNINRRESLKTPRSIQYPGIASDSNHSSNSSQADNTSTSSSESEDDKLHEKYRASNRIFQTIENEFRRNIEDEDLRRVIQICFSSLAVIFVDTLLPKNGNGPFKYARMSNIPVGAAKMLWKRLLLTEDFLNVPPDLNQIQSAEGKQIESIDNGFCQGFNERVPSESDVPPRRLDPALSRGCLDRLLLELDKYHEYLKHQLNLQKIESLKADIALVEEKTQARSSWIQKSQKIKNGHEWLKNAFRPKNKLDSLKGLSKIPQIPKHRSKSLYKRKSISREDALFNLIQELLLKVGVVKLFESSDNNEYTQDLKNYGKEKHRKRISKERKFYFQIQRDMQHQYGRFLSFLPVSDGGFGIPECISHANQKNQELDYDDIRLTLQRENETMVRWNHAMATACWEKRFRKHNSNKNIDLSTKSNKERDTQVDFNNDSEIYPSLTEPWLYENVSTSQLDDATLYAIQMLPVHFMRSVQFEETVQLLQDINFFTVRVHQFGPLMAVTLHKKDMQELETRLSMTNDNFLEYGEAKVKVELHQSTHRILHVMKTALTERYASIRTRQQTDLNDDDPLNKRFRIKGEKIKGGTGRALHAIATLFKKYGWDKEALSCFETSLHYKKIALGENHQSVAGTLNTLGSIYVHDKKYHKALQCYHEALPIERETLGDYDRKVTGTLNNMGMICGMICKYDDATQYYEEELFLERNMYGEDHLRVAETLNSLGIIQCIRGYYEKSIQAHEDALRIKRTKLGQDHIECAEILFNLGMVYNKQDDFDKAVDCYQESLNSKKKIFGEDHEEVARVLHCLGLVLNDMGEYQNSIKFYEEALKIRLIKLGDRHEDVARTLHSLGLVYQKVGNYDRSIECFEGALRVSRVRLGSNHYKTADTLYSLGKVYQKKGKYESALESYDEALEIRIEKLGSSNEDVASIQHNMGDVYYVLQKYSKSMSSYESAFRTRFFKLGADNIDVAATRNNMGVCLLKSGENYKAMECFNEALRVRELRLGPDHEKVGDTLHNLGLVLKNLLRFDEAVVCYEKSLRIRKVQYSSLHTKVADTIYNIAIVHANSNMYSAALDRFKEVLRTYREMGYNNDHHNVKNTIQWIGWVQKQVTKEGHEKI